MKKNYLMEIIREEISSYLGENEPMFASPQDQQREVYSMLDQVENLKKLRADLDEQIAQLEAIANTFNVNELAFEVTGKNKKTVTSFKDKSTADAFARDNQVKVTPLEEEQLDEETLNEAPFIDGPQGVELFSAIKTASERLKNQFPEATPEDIAKIIKNKKTQTQYAPEVKDELAAQFKKYGGGTFTPELGPNQTLKAVAKALGEYEPKPRGRKAGEPKAAAEPKAKSLSKEKPAAAPKAEKPAAAKATPAKAEPKAKMEPEDKADAAAMKAAASSKGGTTRAEKYGMLRNELERVTAELKSLAGSPDMETRKKLSADKMRIELAMDKLKQVKI